MSSQLISPRRRRRILNAHQLRENGATIRQIAKHLGVSPSTIHLDLRLLEEQWYAIEKQAADDSLLTALAALRNLLATSGSSRPGQPFNHRDFVLICRELRQTAAQITKRGTLSRPSQLAEYDDDQLANPDPLAEQEQIPSNTIEPDRSKSITIDQDRSQSITIDQDRSQSITIDQDRTTSNAPQPPRPDKEPPQIPEMSEISDYLAEHLDEDMADRLANYLAGHPISPGDDPITAIADQLSNDIASGKAEHLKPPPPPDHPPAPT